MSVTTGLAWIVVLMGVLAAWRFFRWRWRPRLEPGTALRRRDADGAAADWTLTVRNKGAATARRCRATLLRADRLEADGSHWRFEDHHAFPLTWTDGSPERDLRAGETAELTVADGNRLPAGRYRLEIAVIDGEERRVVLDLAHGEAADAGHGPRRPDEEAR